MRAERGKAAAWTGEAAILAGEVANLTGEAADVVAAGTGHSHFGYGRTK